MTTNEVFFYNLQTWYAPIFVGIVGFILQFLSLTSVIASINVQNTDSDVAQLIYKYDTAFFTSGDVFNIICSIARILLTVSLIGIQGYNIYKISKNDSNLQKVTEFWMDAVGASIAAIVVLPTLIYNLFYWTAHLITVQNWLQNFFARIKTRAVWNWGTEQSIPEPTNAYYFEEWIYYYFFGPKKVQFFLDILMLTLSFLKVGKYGQIPGAFYICPILLGLFDVLVVPFAPFLDLPFFTFDTMLNGTKPPDLVQIIFPILPVPQEANQRPLY